MKVLAFALVVVALLVASPARAQGALVNIQVQFLQNGAALPGQVMTITLPGGAVCGQPRLVVPPGGTFIDTTGRVAWQDPANAALDCISTQTGGTLFAQPVGGGYTITAKFTDDTGAVSSVSLPSNSFTRGARPAPVAPLLLRVVP